MTTAIELGRSALARSVDVGLEATVAGSFSRVGFEARRRSGGWGRPPRLDGRTVLVTGASSGIGQAAAAQLAGLGATVLLVGRDHRRLDTAAADCGGEPFVCDLVEPADIARLAAALAGRDPIAGVVHNAGALFPERRQAPDGTELTVATHVLGPFRLAEALRPRLAQPAVSVIVSSGGMYTQGFDLDRLEMAAAGYRGAVAYARAKRAQVVLAREWARRYGLRSYSMHPGWVATPGLAAGLPGLTRLGPLLRTPAEGADTITWLVANGLGDDPPPGGFYLDRRRRGEHYRPGTRRAPQQDVADGEALWQWCRDRS